LGGAFHRRTAAAILDPEEKSRGQYGWDKDGYGGESLE